MPTGLEQVHAVTEQALKQLDQDARRLNQRLNDTRTDIVKAKAEYEQIVEAIAEAKASLEAVRTQKTVLLKDIDAHRDAQLVVMERAGMASEVVAARAAEAMKQSEATKQDAQESLSTFRETRGVFLQKVKTFQGSLEKAIADLLA